MAKSPHNIYVFYIQWFIASIVYWHKFQDHRCYCIVIFGSELSQKQANSLVLVSIIVDHSLLPLLILSVRSYSTVNPSPWASITNIPLAIWGWIPDALHSLELKLLGITLSMYIDTAMFSPLNPRHSDMPRFYIKVIRKYCKATALNLWEICIHLCLRKSNHTLWPKCHRWYMIPHA